MTIYYNDKQATQDIKKFLTPNTKGKLMDPNDEKLQPGQKRTLPIRGEQPLKKNKAKK